MLKPSSPVTANLIRARELIADPANWCQNDFFREGRACAVGAVIRASDTNVIEDEFRFLTLAACEQRLFAVPSTINDYFGHAAVMTMFDRAIELSLQDA